MEMSERFRRNEEYIYREVAGESLIVPTGNSALQFSGMGAMNSTAAFLWKLLEKERSLAELSRLFADEYDLTAEQSGQDVTEFLAYAQENNLVMRC